MSLETIERSFSVIVPARLRLSNLRGSVDIQPGDDGVIAVKAVIHLDTGDAERTQIHIDQDNEDQVTVATRYKVLSNFLFNDTTPCKVDYIVYIPQLCNIHMDCVSSNASLQGVEGDCLINNVSGALSINDFVGSIKVSSVSGKVKADRLSGTLQLDSVSSSVNITESLLESVNGKSVSGPIIIETPLGEGPYYFKSVSGKFTLFVPEGTACLVSSKSLSGNLKSSLPNAQVNHRGRYKYIKVHSGGPEIHHHSISGDIHLLRSENGIHNKETMNQTKDIEPNQSDLFPAKPMDILERIYSGEISVEEALQQLNT